MPFTTPPPETLTPEELTVLSDLTRLIPGTQGERLRSKLLRMSAGATNWKGGYCSNGERCSCTVDNHRRCFVPYHHTTQQQEENTCT